MNAAPEYVERGNQRYVVVEVQSHSDPTKVYRVDLTNRRCSCPAWVYQRKRNRVCKHLREQGVLDYG